MKNTLMNYTELQKAAVNHSFMALNSFYTREDFERVIAEARKANSAQKSRKGELEVMCEAFVTADDRVEELKEAKRMADRMISEETCEEELKRIHTKRELRKLLMEQLHTLFYNTPSAPAIMERIVRRALKGKFAGDSVRLCIVKKFLEDTDYCTKPIIAWVEEQFTEEEKKEYAKLKKTQKMEYILDHISEEIFENLGGGVQDSQVLDRFRFIFERINSEEGFEGAKAFRALATEVLNERCTLPQEELMEEADKAETEFCAYLKQFQYTKKTGEIATRDEIYKQAWKDFKKSIGKKWELLRLADELANGKFKVNGVTKEQLYIFAVVFDMKVYEDSYEEQTIDEIRRERDLEKNLFHDYYADNLLRYIRDEEYKENNSSYENEPTGEGINYKNYLEVIYLYYLYRDDLGLSAGEKLKKIKAISDLCVKEAKKDAKKNVENIDEKTIWYKSNFYDTMRTISDEKELVEYICSNYHVYGLDGIARIMYSSNQNTAEGYVKEIVETIQKEYHEDFLADERRTGFDYGIEAETLIEEYRKEFSDDKEFLETILHDENFVALLKKTDEKLHIRQKGFFRKNSLDENQKITRTELVVLYFCYFGYVLDEMMDDYGILSLPEVYEEFCEGYGARKGINFYLEECRYQKISEKNIFDMLLVFALYLDRLR